MAISKLLLSARWGRNPFLSETSSFHHRSLQIDKTVIYLDSATFSFGSLTPNVSGSTGKASSIAYVETSVGVTYNFAAHSDSNTTSYIIPTPSELATTTSARWLSDVITINPSCSFAKSNVTKPFSFNSTSLNSTALSFSLPDAGIELIISSFDGIPNVSVDPV
jgi:hypothetical protein